jgi:SRSO17 transposase
LGKQDNCQVVVSLSVANHHASLPVVHRLYLSELWANDAERRAKAGVPSEVTFRTKPEIALDLTRDALTAGISPGTVLADAGYGTDSGFRDGITALGLRYAVGIQSNLMLWKADAVQPPRGRRGGKPSHATRREQQDLGQGTGLRAAR